MLLRPIVLALALTACSSSSTNSDTGGIAYPVNGCTEADFAANDHSADSDPRIIQGPSGDAPAQYTPHCMRVKAGQKVSITGKASMHPVDFSVVQGDPEPFPDMTSKGFVDGGTGTDFDLQTVTLLKEGGVMKFQCTAHPSVMFGAIQTLP